MICNIHYRDIFQQKIHGGNPLCKNCTTFSARYIMRKPTAASGVFLLLQCRWALYLVLRCWSLLLTRITATGNHFSVANMPCYGYCRNKNGDLELIPGEAAVVRLIYDYHRQGMSLRRIARELYSKGILSPRGKPDWSIETIRRILQNEKYYGHVLLQKTYVSDYFTGKRSLNNGELPRYLIENHHEPILEK